MQKSHINTTLDKRYFMYPIFIIAFLGVIIAFITADSYIQLIVATIFYPLLVYFGLVIFPRKATDIHSQKFSATPPPVNKNTKEPERAVIIDLDKRAFLKLAAGAGVSYFVYSILSRKAEGLLMGKAPDSGAVNLQAPNGQTIHPAETQPTDGYQIVEIDESETSYFGFVDVSGNWFIMKETDAGSFRYSKGQSGFPNSWNIRENLKYDYYNRVFL